MIVVRDSSKLECVQFNFLGQVGCFNIINSTNNKNNNNNNNYILKYPALTGKFKKKINFVKNFI